MKVVIMGENFFLLNLNKNGISRQWYWYGSDAQGRMIKSGRRVDLLAQRMGIPVVRPGKKECIHILEAAVSQGIIREGREVLRSGRRGTQLVCYFSEMFRPGSRMIDALNDRRSSELSAEYLNTISSAFSTHAAPKLANVTLGSFSSADAFNLVKRLSSDGLSKHVINSVIKALRMVYGYATMCGDVAGNPTSSLKLYNVKGKERDVFSVAEAKRFLLWFRENDRKAHAFMEFAIRTGARCSEILALKPEKFTRLVSTDGDELPYFVVRIDGSWDRRKKAVGPTKGRYSRETVIPLDLAERLLAMKPSGEGLVFHRGRSRLPYSRFHFERLFNKACQEIGIDEETRKERGLTLHSLRHFAITMQHEAEEDVSRMSDYIRESSGHRSVSMDRHYTHKTVEKYYAMGLLSEKVLE